MSYKIQFKYTEYSTFGNYGAYQQQQHQQQVEYEHQQQQQQQQQQPKVDNRKLQQNQQKFSYINTHAHNAKSTPFLIIKVYFDKNVRTKCKTKNN
ncbi:hypothetical protein PPL_06475, partial [Heterostelium album PN500]